MRKYKFHVRHCWKYLFNSFQNIPASRFSNENEFQSVFSANTRWITLYYGTLARRVSSRKINKNFSLSDWIFSAFLCNLWDSVRSRLSSLNTSNQVMCTVYKHRLMRIVWNVKLILNLKWRSGSVHKWCWVCVQPSVMCLINTFVYYMILISLVWGWQKVYRRLSSITFCS